MTNKEKKPVATSEAGSARKTTYDASKEAFTRKLTLKVEEKFNCSGAKLTEPRPVSGKGI